jgi:MoaA/NifB/PqqE/SkfB family radical SAM enzyme
MHEHETVEPDTATLREFKLDRDLDFLWLELTNRCNLQCVHCYTESHPARHDRDVLTKQEYESIMLRAYELGCRKVQFIGGEPQLNRHFKSLLRSATETGFDFVEVFSNLTFLDDETIEYSADHHVCFATSVYSDDPAVHDAVTKVRSSHAKTIANLEKLIAKDVVTRAGIIIIDQEPDEIDRTKRFLERLGVGSVRVSLLREFGRGEQILSRSACLEGLCGHCWKGKLAVAPDGVVYPCVMARQWSVGNLYQDSLSDIVRGKALESIRRSIFDVVWLPRLHASTRAPEEPAPRCHPDCSECCDPDGCPETPCAPGCCPQSCIPDLPQ